MEKIQFLDFLVHYFKFSLVCRIVRNLNPKYIELYSNKPPNKAPKIFEDKATDDEFNSFSSEENANPEKKIGIVKNIGIRILARFNE